MAKLEWGTKRVCQSCETRFFDLRKDPIICPKCNTEYEVPKALRVFASAEAAPVNKAAKEEKDLDADVIDDTLEDEESDEGLIEDTSDLDDSLEGVASSSGKPPSDDEEGDAE